MATSRQIVERFKNKEVGITFDDGGKFSFARGIIVSADESGFILKFKNVEQFFSYDCVQRIREIFKEQNGSEMYGRGNREKE